MSLVYLGYIYEVGLSVESDLSTAESYYRRAYEGGSIGGLFGLGSIYLRLQNYQEAEKMFLLGSDKQDMRSMYWLARVYLKDHNNVEKQQKAIRLLERSYSMGHIL